MAKSYSTMFALAFIASFIVTPSLASLSVVGRQASACPYNGTSDQGNFTLLAVTKSVLGIRRQLALVSDGSSGPSGYIGVSSLPLSATIVLIRRIFCRSQTI